VAAKGAEAHLAHLDLLARSQLEALVIDHDEHAVALDYRTLLRKVERHDRDVFLQDVLPDIELGPVGQREDADRFSPIDAGVVDPPHLRALVLGVPAVMAVAEREDALLGPALFLVAARAAEGRVKAVKVERLAQRLR